MCVVTASYRTLASTFQETAWGAALPETVTEYILDLVELTVEHEMGLYFESRYRVQRELEGEDVVKCTACQQYRLSEEFCEEGCCEYRGGPYCDSCCMGD